MKHHFLFLFLAAVVFFSAALPAQSAEVPEPFRNLAVLHIEHTLGQYGFGDITIHYDPGITTVIDSLYQNPYKKEAGYGPDRRLISTKIDRNVDATFTVDFFEGFSVDPCIEIYRNTGADMKKLANGSIGGTTFIIPGDGFLYISGHTNNTFDQRRMYRVEGDTITEIEQPFYYAGMKTVANVELPLRNDTGVFMTLPAGSPVEVLAMKNAPYPEFRYLVKTETGIVGWAVFKPEDLYMWTKPNPIEGLFFNGD